MASTQPDPHEGKVRSVPLPVDDGEVVVAQENMGPEVARGGGEWPPPDVPPEGPAPGTAAGGEAGPDDGDPSRRTAAGTFPPFRDVLREDPLPGGSRSVAPEDDDR